MNTKKMCYSKEVSLVAGATITGLSYWYYLKFYLLSKTQKNTSRAKLMVENIKKNVQAKNVRDFSLWLILGFASIGGHQFGEFLSIATGSELIYKIGLVSSILCTYFITVAFERLSGKKIGSWMIALVIFIVTIDIFRTPMLFENKHFWVRGFNHQVWSGLWIANWIYLCSAIVLLGSKAKLNINKRLYWLYGLGGINISFILSWMYAILASRYGNVCTIANCSYHFLQDFRYTYDFPSLWCTFTVIQGPFIYLVLKKMKEGYEPETFNDWNPTWKTRVALVMITILIIWAWYYITPTLLGVSWKQMTR